MTNSIVGQPTPIPPRVDSRTPSQRETDVAGDAKSWHSAFEHAQGGAFQGWFQPPGMQRPASNATHGAIVATWAIGGTPGHVAASQAATPPSSHAAADPGNAGASHAARPDRAPAAPRDAAAAPAAAAPATGIVHALQAPEVRDQALASMLAALAGVAVALVPGLEPDDGTPPPAALTGSAAAPGFTAIEEPAVDLPAEAATRPQPQPDAASEPREPLRVHAQWSDDGVRLWLGADAGGLAAVDAVTAQLRQALATQGARLLRVVCNGRDITPPATTAGADATRFDAAAEPASTRVADRVSSINF